VAGDRAALIDQALQLHRAGKLGEARVLYERAIATSGPWPEAQHLLAMVAIAEGAFAEAIALVRAAIAADPAGPALHHHTLGEALRRAERPDEALDAYRAAVVRDPALVEAQLALGDLLRARGEAAAAVACFTTALARRRDDPRIHLRLGEGYAALGAWHDAASSYRQAIAHGLDRGGVHNNLGLALSRAGDGDGAIQAFRRAAVLDAADPTPLVNLGDAYLGEGDAERAEHALRAALALDATLPAAHLNLGNVQRRRNRLTDAAQSYRRATELAPGNARTHGNLGLALIEAGQANAGIAALRRAVALAPDDPVTASNLCYAMCYDAAASAAAVLDEHLTWDACFGRPGQARAQAGDRDPDRRLRIGYVSPDFRTHPVGSFVAGPIAHHDRTQVEVTCYSATRRPDAVTARLRAAADRWRDIVPLNDEDLAAQISADGIDILVDLSGHMAGNRLPAFALRPAPLQVSWAGYPFSTGSGAIDWAFVDAAIAPQGAEALFTERLLRLPRVWTCYTPPDALPDIPARDHDDIVRFGSFNNPQKIDVATIALWARLVAAVPDARLTLKAPAFDDVAIRGDFARRFAAAGLAEGRIDFAGASSWQDQLRAIAGVDIALDPLPYSGATTTIETLLMGVPVVTLAGDAYFRRHAMGMLGDVGLGDLVGGNAQEYVAAALAIASDPARRARLRGDLRPAMQAAPVCDTAGFTRDLENAYRTIWRDWCGA
jgi:protein O-GlcNAc transferase